MLLRLVRAAFKLNEGEGRKVLEFALLGALLQGALAVGISAADSMFLARVGAEGLPLVYLLTPAVMLAYIPLYSFFLARYGIDRLFDLTLALLACGGVAIAFGVAYVAENTGVEATTVIYAVKLYAVLWYIALYSLYWNFTDGFFDILDAKRIYALLAAGAASGAALGGALVAYLSSIAKVEQFFLVWALLSLITLPVVLRLRRRWERLDTSEQDTDSKARVIDQAKSVLQNFNSSRFTVILTSVLFCTMVVTLICEYQYMAVFAQHYSEGELAGLFGKLFFVANLLNLFITLFLFNRVVARVGIRNVALLQPIVYTATFVFFLLDQSVAAGVVGFFAYHGLLTAVDYNNSNLLFNALPTGGKKQLRTFIEGLCEPAANLVAGSFLIILASQLSPEQISGLGLCAALFCLVLVLIMRPAYVDAMIANLRCNWLDFSSSLGSIIQKFSPQDLETLQRMAADVRHPDSQLTAVRMLMNRNPHQGARALLRILTKVRAPLGKPHRDLIAQLCRIPDLETMKGVLSWLETESRNLDPAVLEQFAVHGLVSIPEGKELFGSNRTESRLAGVAALRHSGAMEELLGSMQVINGLLAEGTMDRASAVRALGYFQFENHAQILLPYLRDADPRVRSEALMGLTHIVTRDSTRLVPALLEVIVSGSSEDRVSAIECLNRIGDAGSIPELLKHAEHLRPGERRKVEQLICEIGLPGVPSVVAVLKDEQTSHSARSVAARAMARLSFPQLESIASELISTEVRRAYDHHAAEWTLRQANREGDSCGMTVLCALYREQRESVIEFILELLALSGRLPDFELLLVALNSDNQKERGNAIETIQQACSSEMNRILLPLVDSRTDAERLAFYRATFDKFETPVEELLERAAASEHPLEAIAAAQALWEAQGEKASNQLRAIVQQRAGTLVGDSLIELLERSRKDISHTVSANSTERVAHLLAHTLFSSFRVTELYELARRASLRGSASQEVIYEEGQAARSIFFVIEGEVLVQSGERSERKGALEIVGIEALLGRPQRKERMVSSGATLLEIPVELILEQAEGDWRIATSLISAKFAPSEESV